jgi:beta-galactosidase
VLWSAESPNLYKAVSYIRSNNVVTDSVITPFGIRTIHADAKNGLLVNGHPTELKGGCIHHDNGPLGSATYDRAEERKIEILKQNGFNAIRTSHNPPSTPLLEACDRLGMYVIDEAFDMWQRPKNPEDYHLYFDSNWKKDLTSMIRRDRNHPAVIFWSIGNEINERADSSGLVIEKKLINEVRRLDTTRMITEAICFFWDHPGWKWDTTAKAFALLGVGGYNYQWKEYEPDHIKFPERIMMGTESVPKESWENWQQVEQHPYVIGDFVWTAFDYMGETGIGHSILNNRPDSFAMTWPWYNAYCGDIDLTGFKKPQSYYRDVVWDRSPVEIAVHRPLPDTMKEIVSYWGWPDEMQSWTWHVADGKPMEVRVFSKARHVRLELNGKIVGEQDIPANSITAVFTVPYQPGTLKAIVSDNGSGKGTKTLQTTGSSARVRLTPDRSSISSAAGDLSYVTVEIVDQQGNIVPDAEVPLQFEIAGTGELAATGNANPSDMASFTKPERKTFRGRCIAIVRSNGDKGMITVRVKAKGLESGETQIETSGDLRF